jgi:hypothetical protein
MFKNTVVCDYGDEPGNWLGEQVYIKGEPGSACV